MSPPSTQRATPHGVLLIAVAALLLLSSACARDVAPTEDASPDAAQEDTGSEGRDAAPRDAEATDSSPSDTARQDTAPDTPPGDTGAPDTTTPPEDTSPPPECIDGDTRFCETSCGTQGLQRCNRGRYGACLVAEELCNGSDDDCDGDIDEGIGARACSSDCGGGTEACADGRWEGCTAVNPQPEVCDGRDDDCDGDVDEGLTRACSNACGDGVETCDRGQWVSCSAPSPVPEQCDGRDNDCDGQTDEIARSCSTVCGGGAQQCDDGEWLACDAPEPEPEECNNEDDDCDGDIDEGTAQTCSTACGAGVETCDRGRWVDCSAPDPEPELCNGEDDDCDGDVDEGLARSCSTACGEGVETCDRGSWVGCTAPEPESEACNNEDDDCDGEIDESFQVQVESISWSALSDAQPPCQSRVSGLDVCLTAAHRHCSRSDTCLRSGAGPDPHLTAPSIACLGRSVTSHSASIASVAAETDVAVTDETVRDRLGWSATHRYCTNRGFEGGVGPVEHNNGTMFMRCIPDDISEVVGFPTTQFTARGCTIAGIDSPQCTAAAVSLCQGAGWEWGHGPVEWNPQFMHVVCLGD